MRMYRLTITAGSVAVMALQGGCDLQAQPQAQALTPPPVIDACTVPIPTGVVYHQAQDRWEVLLAPPTFPPDPQETELLNAIPLVTYAPGGVIEGFVPASEVFDLVASYATGTDSIRGKLPHAISFIRGRWHIHLQETSIPERPLVELGAYEAWIERDGSSMSYRVRLTGQDQVNICSFRVEVPE